VLNIYNSWFKLEHVSFCAMFTFIIATDNIFGFVINMIFASYFSLV